MKRPTLRLALIPVLLLAATPSTPVAAQSSGSGCPAQSAIEENDQIAIGRTWLPMRIGIDMAKMACRAHDFLVNFFKKNLDPDKATLDDVMEASKPNTSIGNDPTYRAKLNAMPSPTKAPGWNPNPQTEYVVLPPTNPGGDPVLFQPNGSGGRTPSSVSEIQGNGTLLSTDGMKRGTFVGGKLNGVGEEIDPNGTWRAGTYDRGTNQGQVFEVRNVGGRTYLVTGSVVNGKLDGLVERIFANGMTQMEDWEGGKLMQVGLAAPKGQPALAPQTRYKPPVEVATTDAYRKVGPRPKIAPGTTFDPARTVGRPRAAKALSFEKAFADYKRSCQRIVLIKLKGAEIYGDYQRLGREGFAEQMYRSAGVSEDFAIDIFKTPDIQKYVAFLNNNAWKYPGNVNDQKDDDISYSGYALSVCAVNARLRQLGMPILSFWG